MFSPKKKKKKQGRKGKICEVMDVLIMGEILRQCMLVSRHHDLYVKYLTISLVNYTSIKLKFKTEERKEGNQSC